MKSSLIAQWELFHKNFSTVSIHQTTRKKLHCTPKFITDIQELVEKFPAGAGDRSKNGTY